MSKFHFYCLKNCGYETTFEKHFYSLKEHTNAEFVNICSSLMDRAAKDALTKSAKKSADTDEHGFNSVDWTDITVRICELLEENGFHAINSMEAFIVGSWIGRQDDFHDPPPGTYSDDANRVRKSNVTSETAKNIVAFNSMILRKEPEW